MVIIVTMVMPKKDESFRNDMTNFGILMEIRGIDKPFKWARELVGKVQENSYRFIL